MHPLTNHICASFFCCCCILWCTLFLLPQKLVNLFDCWHLSSIFLEFVPKIQYSICCTFYVCNRICMPCTNQSLPLLPPPLPLPSLLLKDNDHIDNNNALNKNKKVHMHTHTYNIKIYMFIYRRGKRYLEKNSTQT